MKMNYRQGLLLVGLVAGVGAGLLVFSASTIQGAPEGKITICHADGKDGTIKFSNITVSPSAAATHLDPITGTPQAGHEGRRPRRRWQVPDEPSPSPTPTPTPTPGV
jgi:hypothetical protein